MSLPRNVAKILQEHVTFELECIDRMYLNVYVPALPMRKRGGGILPPPPRLSVRLVGIDGPNHQRASSPPPIGSPRSTTSR